MVDEEAGLLTAKNNNSTSKDANSNKFRDIEAYARELDQIWKRLSMLNDKSGGKADVQDFEQN